MSEMELVKEFLAKLDASGAQRDYAPGVPRYGYSMRVSSGNPATPGCLAITWIRGRDEAERDAIRVHSRKIVENFMRSDGFIGMVTGFTGDQGFTVTAWQSEQALQAALRTSGHLEAMADFDKNGLAVGVWTSVWQPHHINRMWQRCPACNHANVVSDKPTTGLTCESCGAPLPDRISYW